MGQVANNPVVLEKGLRADFMKAYDSTEPPALINAAMKVQSSSASEKFGWLGNAPTMQEFKDEKSPKGLADFNFTIRNVPYEATIKVDKYTLINDQIGAIKVRINDLSTKAKVFPAKLMLQLLVAGTTQLCYDGQPFFSGSHSEGVSGTQSNLLTGTGVASLDQLMADFNAAQTALLSYKDDAGEPWYEDAAGMQLLVVCPTALAPAFKRLFGTALIANTTNTLQNAAQVMASARLTGNSWYLLNIAGAIKPFILQENQPVSFGSLEGDSDEGFKRRFYLYGVEWYGNVGYGLWQKAAKVVNS